MKKEPINTTDINKKPYFGPIPKEYTYKDGDTLEDLNRKVKAVKEIHGWPEDFELTEEHDAAMGTVDMTEANSGQGIVFGLGKSVGSKKKLK